jgi:uncharacterized protein
MTTAGTLINRRTSRVLAVLTELAADRRSRRRGLLGREGLPQSSALLLVPCQAIHTWFMRFPIDVLFVDRGGRVLKTCPDVRPWKIRACPAATGVVELPAGVIERTETRVGDAIDLSFQGDKVRP